jgi:hypothetical protein
MQGFPPELAWHAGKVSECGTRVCETLGKSVIFTTVSRDEITIRPYGDGLRSTPRSVAAHSLYENSDPYLHRECAGTFDLTKSIHEASDAVTVKIRGSEFKQEPYTVKLEGAALAGYQSIIVAGIRDPYIIPSSDSWIAGWPRCAAISTKAHLMYWATRQIRVRTALSFILAVSML